MHENSLVQTMLNTLEDNFGSLVETICRVKLTAGLLSNVPSALIYNAFDAVLLERPEYRHIALAAEVLPIVIACSECGKRTEVKTIDLSAAAASPLRRLYRAKNCSSARCSLWMKVVG